MVGAYLPPQWPTEVPHPASPAFQGRVVSWLLDLCPADYRDEPTLTRYPVVLVRLAQRSVAAQGRGVDLAIGGIRAELVRVESESVIEKAIEALVRQRERLLRVRRELTVVEHALRGGEFIERL